MQTNQIQFNNHWYKMAVDLTGNVKFYDKENQEILSSIQYYAEYGDIYNVRYPLEQSGDSVILDKTSGLNAGDWVEVRNEFRRGFMNMPQVHHAKIININDKQVKITPPITDQFCSQQILSKKLCVFLKKTTDRLNGFDSFIFERVHYEPTIGTLHFSMRGETAKTTVWMHYEMSDHSPAINVNVHTKYKESVKVINEALRLNFSVGVSEVYRKNRKMDKDDFQNEYWLDGQGVKFGSGSRSAFIYHAPQVSSLRLVPPENRLSVNLDDMFDHRFARDAAGLHYQGVSLRTFDAHHTAKYECRQERINKFTLIAGYSPLAVPRLMINPNGYQATMVWTEHADKSTLPSNKAVYYGREDIESATEATGGFVKYRVPVTKSVFYANPSSRSYTDLTTVEGARHIPQTSIKENPDFVKFLDELHALGHDICLHAVTASQDDESRELMEEAASLMKARFKSESWIDHGRNRFNISTDGLIPNSEFYAADLWEKYGIKYFWHYCSEDITHTHTGNIDLLQIKKGDHLPTPLYWLHPTATRDFYSWAAVATRKLKLYNEKSLNELVNHWGVCINHVYPPEIFNKLSDSDYFDQDPEGKFIAHPEFNDILNIMSDLREEGKLNLTTIRGILKYWILLENISFQYEDTNTVYVCNNNPGKIENLSLVVHQVDILVDGSIPRHKKAGDETIFWFDMQPMSRAKITLQNTV